MAHPGYPESFDLGEERVIDGVSCTCVRFVALDADDLRINKLLGATWCGHCPVAMERSGNRCKFKLCASDARPEGVYRIVRKDTVHILALEGWLA